MKRIVFFILLFCFSVLLNAQRSFIHPGLSHKKSDLDRMRYMVASGIEPWKSSYIKLIADSKSSYNYTVRGNSSMTVITQDGTNYGAFSSDVKAAYLNALIWAVNGDTRHAAKAVEIFNAWSNITQFTGGGTESLNAGRVIWQFIEAAEIIKSTFSGWNAADIQKFKDMLVYPGYSDVAKPVSVTNTNGTFYWRMYNGDPGRHGNQDLFGWRGVMAIAIFSDNEKMYDRALRYVKGLPAHTDDIPYQTGPPIVSANPVSTNDYFDTYTLSGYNTTIAEYGYNGVIGNYIWENGQCQESSRDQDHGILGVGMLASIAEMAWNQGDDLYSLLNRRILKGYEFSMHYNVSYKNHFADQLTPWEPTVESGEFIQRRDRSWRWFSRKINPHYESDFIKVSRGSFLADKRPIYELAIAHYQIRMGLPDDSLKWTLRAHNRSLDSVGYEGNGWSLDHLGWGGLTCRRLIGMAGDPCTFENGKPQFSLNVFPGILNAVNFDYFPADAGGGEGKTFHDLTPGNIEGVYRTDGDMDIEPTDGGGYNLTDLEPGEWVNYTVCIPSAGPYEILVRYAAGNGNGKIKFSFNGTDKTGEVSLPYGGPYSAGWQDWKIFTLTSEATLEAGVLSMRIYILGSEKAFNLSSVFIKKGQVISFNPIPVKKTGDADFTPLAFASSGLPAQFTSSNSEVATIESRKIHIVGEGTSVITASQEGNYDWGRAPDVTQILTVSNDSIPPDVGISFIEESTIKVRPNPSDGIFQLEIPDVIVNSAKIFLVDPLGKEIKSVKICDRINNIDITNYPSGIYFVIIKSNEYLLIRKIIKI